MGTERGVEEEEAWFGGAPLARRRSRSKRAPTPKGIRDVGRCEGEARDESRVRMAGVKMVESWEDEGEGADAGARRKDGWWGAVVTVGEAVG